MASVGLVTFDTLAFVKKMAASGMPGEQAEALAAAQAEIITNSLATKDDLALYYQQGEAKFNELDAKVNVLDVKIEALNEKVVAQGEALNEKIIGLNEKIETQVKMLQHDIVIKLGGLMVVLFALLRVPFRSDVRFGGGALCL